MILMMGFELVRSSIDKIMHPEALSFSVPALIVLLLSIGVKIWMALFNHQLGKRIDSPAVGAVVMDSVSDTAANDGFHARADPLPNLPSLPLDGYMGIIVALFIFYTAFRSCATPWAISSAKRPTQSSLRHWKRRFFPLKAWSACMT